MNNTEAMPSNFKGYALVYDKDNNIKFDYRSQLDSLPPEVKNTVDKAMSEGKVRILEEE
jgi:hypothetical protein